MTLSPKVFRDTFDTGRTAPTVSIASVVKSLDVCRDTLSIAQWKLHRGFVGLGSITFPLGLPDASTPIINGLNRFVCTVNGAASPATTESATQETYAVPLGANLVVNINGRGNQTIPLTGGAARTAEQVADDIAATLVDAVPWVAHNQVGISTLGAGSGYTIDIISGNYFDWTAVDGADTPSPLSYYFWNHNFETTHPDFGTDAVWIDVAAVAGALGGLQGAITATQNALIADIVDSHTLSLRAVGGGSFSAFVTLTGNGFQDLVGNPSGGGWQLRSRSQKDDDSTSDHDAHLLASFTGRTIQAGITVEIIENGTSRFTFNPQLTPTRTPFNVWANPYGLAMVNDEPFHAGDIYVGNSFFHFTLLKVQVPNVTRCWLCMNGFAARETLGVGNAFANASSLVEYNGIEYTYSPAFSQGGVSVLMPHYYNGPLLNRVGKPLQFEPYFMFAPNNVNRARIEGKMWDAFGLTQNSPFESLVDNNGTFINWMSFAGDNAAPAGTIFLLWPRLTKETTGSGTAPARSGIVNVIFDTVTLLSGDPFTPHMVGKGIYIEGQLYTVLSFVDETQIRLTVSINSIASANYHT